MGHKRTRPKEQRLRMAKDWLPTYNGTKIVKGYKKKFAVDSLTAISDLLELGVTLEPSYIEAVKRGEEVRRKQLDDKKQEKLMEQHSIEILYEEMGIWDGVYEDYNDDIDVTTNHHEPERSRAALAPVLPKAKLLSVNFENRIGTVKKAGKNHVKVNGTLLQTNKKWSHLKQRQRDWIYEVVRAEHEKFIDENERLPMKAGKKKLIAIIEMKIDERGIWLPSHEMEQGIGKYIDRLNRKNPMFVVPQKKNSKPENPAPPKVGIEDFPESVQLEVREKFAKLIKGYKSQAKRLPSDKTRSGHIKVVLSGFNSKQWKTYEKRMTKTAALLDLYDEVKREIERSNPEGRQ